MPINIESTELFEEGKISDFKERIAIALKNFNLIEGEDVFALYFKDVLIRTNLVLFTKVIESVFPNSIAKNKVILVILKGDGAKMLGLTLKKETSIQSNLFCLDELELEAGDWIDIGESLQTNNRKAFPVTIKSLVFNKNKKE